MDLITYQVEGEAIHVRDSRVYLGAFNALDVIMWAASRGHTGKGRRFGYHHRVMPLNKDPNA